MPSRSSRHASHGTGPISSCDRAYCTWNVASRVLAGSVHSSTTLVGFISTQRRHLGHNYTGHNYMNHDYMDYKGHHYIGHKYIEAMIVCCLAVFRHSADA